MSFTFSLKLTGIIKNATVNKGNSQKVFLNHGRYFPLPFILILSIKNPKITSSNESTILTKSVIPAIFAGFIPCISRNIVIKVVIMAPSQVLARSPM